MGAIRGGSELFTWTGRERQKAEGRRQKAEGKMRMQKPAVVQVEFKAPALTAARREIEAPVPVACQAGG